MKTYAIIRSNVVWNTIVAFDLSTVEYLMTGLAQEYDEIVEVTEATKAAAPGFDYVDGCFRRPKPSDAYVWNDKVWDWSPKEPKPTDGTYYWNYDAESWQKVNFDVE